MSKYVITDIESITIYSCPFNSQEWKIIDTLKDVKLVNITDLNKDKEVDICSTQE